MSPSKNEQRGESLKQLEICPKCAGYMRPEAPIATAAQRRDWKHETQHRSFGGLEIRRFMCEACQHIEVFQTDPLAYIQEDD